MNDPVIVAATPKGYELARGIRRHLGRGALVDAASDPAAPIQRAYRRGQPLVCVLPMPVIVRALGPMLTWESAEPPVVAVDEQAKSVVSVLGHADPLASEVASALETTAVLSKSAPVLPTPAVDLIGRKWAWKLENAENLDRVAATVARCEPVAVYQDAGPRDWWKPFGPWPHHFERVDTWPDSPRWQALLVISDRILPPPPPALNQHTVTYRPQTLTLGICCSPDARESDLYETVCEFFVARQLSLASLAALAAPVEFKGHVCLEELAERLEVPFLTYAEDKLQLATAWSESGRDPGGETIGPSGQAALLAAGARQLIGSETQMSGVALAVARRATG